MILVDTSVWIDHLRGGEAELVTALGSEQVLLHPFVIGELACGNLKNREEVLSLLQELPKAAVATDTEVLSFIERRSVMGRLLGRSSSRVSSTYRSSALDQGPTARCRCG